MQSGEIVDRFGLTSMSSTWRIPYFTSWFYNEAGKFNQISPLYKAPNGSQVQFVLQNHAHSDHFSLELHQLANFGRSFEKLNYTVAIVDCNHKLRFKCDLAQLWRGEPVDSVMDPTVVQRFIPKREVLNETTLPGDCLTVYFKIEVINENEFRFFAPRLNLGSLLLKTSTEQDDVVLVVEGTELRAHRPILCSASTVFANLLEGTRARRVRLKEITSETARKMLDFLYWTDSDLTDFFRGISLERVRDLMDAACKLEVTSLKAVCEEYLTLELSSRMNSPPTKTNVQVISDQCISNNASLTFNHRRINKPKPRLLVRK